MHRCLKKYECLQNLTKSIKIRNKLMPSTEKCQIMTLFIDGEGGKGGGINKIVMIFLLQGLRTTLEFQ